MFEILGRLRDKGHRTLAAVSLAAALSLLAGPTLAQTFAYLGAKENWSPTVNGTYRVTATGASGGSSSSRSGGHGAEVSGTFTLTVGTTYVIAVGKQGDTDFAVGGGGGGTFFVEAGSPDVPLLVAGGGGGGAGSISNGGAATGPGGDGLGGDAQARAGAGGGFYSDGAPGTQAPDRGGKSWANGLVAGTGATDSRTVQGGFGGGGAGDATGYFSSGGGGGYSGGDGGATYNSGSGGGSFNAGTDQTFMVSSGTGNGSLVIELIAVDPPDTSAAAEAAIADFLATRNQLLLSNGPNLQQFIDRFYGTTTPGTVGVMGYRAAIDLPLDLQFGPDAARFRYSSANAATAALAGAATDTTGLLNYAPALGDADTVQPSGPVEKLAFWAEGSFAKASDDTLFGVVHVGGDYLVNDRVLIGIAGEVDRMTQEGSTATLSGTGYSVGPYVTVRLTDTLFFDARVAGGQSFNEITQDGADTDAFTGTRWLGSTALTGQFDVGAVRIAPTARLSAITETTEAYTDHNGDAVSEVTATTATAELGPRLSLKPEEAGGLTPYLDLTALWTIASTNSLGLDTAADTDPLRARIGAGASLATEGGLSARANAFYDGLGTNWHAWGATFGLDAALQ